MNPINPIVLVNELIILPINIANEKSQVIAVTMGL